MAPNNVVTYTSSYSDANLVLMSFKNIFLKREFAFQILGLTWAMVALDKQTRVEKVQTVLAFSL